MANTTFAGPVISQRGFKIENPSGPVSGSLLTLGNIDVSLLPAAADYPYAIVFSGDCLKASETTGSGTGNVVFSDGSNWIRVDTGTVASA